MKRGDSTPQGCTPPQGRPISLSSFFEEVYQPLKLRHKNRAETYNLRTTISKLARFLRRPPVLTDLNRETIEAFAERLKSEGAKADVLHKVRHRLANLWKCSTTLGFGAEFVNRPHWCKKQAEPHGEPGTVVHFFATVFKPQIIPQCCPLHHANYVTMLRKLPACFGRELLLSELTAATLARFVAWLHETQHSISRAKKFRSLLLTIWRYAHDIGEAPPVPARIRPMKVPREQPDAWSLRELGRILDAARALRKPPIEGIPAGLYWRALLLVGWYTGLRRRALHALTPQNVDLPNRWIYAPASAMKTFVGKRYRIGEDAAEALQAIYDPQRSKLFPMNHLGLRIRCHFRDILTLAGIPASRLPNKHFHKLRRTTASHVAAAAGLAAASALLGHTGPELLKRYIDPTYIVGNDATEFLPPLASEEGGNRG